MLTQTFTFLWLILLVEFYYQIIVVGISLDFNIAKAMLLHFIGTKTFSVRKNMRMLIKSSDLVALCPFYKVWFAFHKEA